MLHERDLYAPVAQFFLQQGFEVKGEVLGCDLVAAKEGTLIVVELKLAFNAKLLYQAVRRLAITEKVYIAVPKPKAKQKLSYWQMMKSLSRRLNIGLLVVSTSDVLVLAEPEPFQNKFSVKRRNQLLKEFNGRRVAQNTGGTTGQKIETAYLESAVHISVLLKKYKALKPKALVELGATEKCGTILRNNYYGWFEKSAGTKYRLKRGQAKKIATENPRIWEFYETYVEKLK
ncbi:MAG: hypothetical protein LDLANPLL_02662 [Turneriella sp.]|nr:hypothetical protein [Turneriella sp.]